MEDVTIWNGNKKFLNSATVVGLESTSICILIWLDFLLTTFPFGLGETPLLVLNILACQLNLDDFSRQNSGYLWFIYDHPIFWAYFKLQKHQYGTPLVPMEKRTTGSQSSTTKEYSLSQVLVQRLSDEFWYLAKLLVWPCMTHFIEFWESTS